MRKTPADLLAHAREMRHEATCAEQALWRALRSNALGVKFRRQVPKGRYILDFACLSHWLVIEVDGDEHADSTSDQRRDAWLRAEGFHVLRFGNREVLQELPGVLQVIAHTLEMAVDTTLT